MDGARYQGLDRGEIVSTMALLGVKKKHRAALFDQLRQMEGAALAAMVNPDAAG